MNKRSDFKVGDHVIAVSGKHIGNWAPNMDKHVGKKAVVTKVTDNFISIDVDGGFHNWSASGSPEAFLEFDMDMLVETAKKRYPVGTQYYCANHHSRRRVLQGDFTNPKPGFVWGDVGEGVLFEAGRWAKIIDEVVPEQQYERCVSLGSKVVFTVVGKKYNYKVEETHLSNQDYDNNHAIFKALKIADKQEFATKAYGYVSGDGDWPTYKEDDYRAAQRLIDKLFEACFEFNKRAYEESIIDSQYKSGDKVFLKRNRHGVSPKWVTIKKVYPDKKYELEEWAGLFPEDDFLPFEPKFKVGDIVVANKRANARYRITKEGWAGTVIDIVSKNQFKAENLPDSESILATLDVECFDYRRDSYHDTKAEFQKKLAKMYPPGTMFIPIDADHKVVVKEDWYIGPASDECSAWFDDPKGNAHVGYICIDGKFAEIIGHRVKEEAESVTVSSTRPHTSVKMLPFTRI